MRKAVTAIALGLFALGVGPGVALAGPCDEFADGYRQFTGKLDKVDKKKGRIYVDNRKGDKVQFHKADSTIVGTQVEDLEKAAFDDLRKDDWVTVYWKFIDKPRKAYCVEVLPPREDD